MIRTFVKEDEMLLYYGVALVFTRIKHKLKSLMHFSPAGWWSYHHHA